MKNKINKTFLGYLYYNKPFLFIVVFLFILMQIIISYRAVETFPFLNYGMYSHRFKKQKLFELKVLNTKDVKLSKRSTEILLNSYNHYLSYKKNGDPVNDILENRFSGSPIYCFLKRKIINEPYKLKKYPHWVETFKYKNNINLVRIYTLKLTFTNGKFKRESKEIIAEF